MEDTNNKDSQFHDDTKEYFITTCQEELSDLGINKVDVSGGLFGMFEHKVTGKELNDIIEQIQKNIIDIKQNIDGFICEFKNLYKALDVMDERYISELINAVEASEQVAKQVQDTREDINKIFMILEEMNSKKSISDNNVEDICIEGSNEEIKYLKKELFEVKENTIKKVSDLDRKLKISCILGGGAILLFVIETILNIMRIL